MIPNDSWNIVFHVFWNHCFWRIPESLFLSIPETHNCPHIRTKHIPESLFFGRSGTSVFSVFRNRQKTLFSEPKTFLKHCFFEIPEHFVFPHSRNPNSTPIQERRISAVSGMANSTPFLEHFWGSGIAVFWGFWNKSFRRWVLFLVPESPGIWSRNISERGQERGQGKMKGKWKGKREKKKKEETINLLRKETRGTDSRS